MKLTKKQHYTRFLTTYNPPFMSIGREYINFPRKKKKRVKRFAIRRFYYDKQRGVCVFNPKLLATPMPRGLMDIFRTDKNMPSDPTMKFIRYSEN